MSLPTKTDRETEPSASDLDQIPFSLLHEFLSDNPRQSIQVVPPVPHEAVRTPCLLSIPLKPIVIVSNDPMIRSTWSKMIQEEHYQTHECSCESFLTFSRAKSAELSLLIIDTDHLTELMFEYSEFFHDVYVNTPVILIGDEFRNRLNRRDYPEYMLGHLKEYDPKILLTLVYSALKVYKTIQEKNALRLSTGIPICKINFFGSSLALKRLEEEIRFAAAQDGPVFIDGEPGTHRDVIASQIHALSTRGQEPFDVFPFTPGLSEFYNPLLFGLEKGTHPQQPEGRVGKLELLNRGTIYIEEIDRFHASAQERLLFFLMNKSLCRINSVKPLPCETRVLVSGSIHLKDWLAVGAFSAELFEAVSQVTVHVPPLRELVESIPEWITVTAHWMCEKIDKTPPRFSDAAVEKMMKYPWPGNTDEFIRTIRRLIHTNGTGIVEADDIVFAPSASRQGTSLVEFVGLSHEEMSRRFIKETLRLHRGNRAAAARVLGISERTLAKKLKEIDKITPKPEQESSDLTG